jgi:hypothetical protein
LVGSSLLISVLRVVTESPAPSKSGIGDSVSCLTARWALSSAASGQDIPGQEGEDDDRRAIATMATVEAATTTRVF